MGTSAPPKRQKPAQTGDPGPSGLEPETVTATRQRRVPAPGTAEGQLEEPRSPGQRHEPLRESVESKSNDAALQDFAFDRERAIQTAEHQASVQRLRQAVELGLIVWPTTGLLDWWVVHSGGKGSLSTLLFLRGLGLLAGLAVLFRLRRPPRPSVRLLRSMDIGIFTWVSILVSVMCLQLGGISSAYATGIVVILVARGATMFDRWQAGVWLFGIPALSYPTVMLCAAWLYPDIKTQFGDPVHLGLFGTSLTFLATTWLLLTVGGNFVWSLRRETLQARSIGRYKLERLLGRGGMGEVWAARDLTLKHRVALKILRSESRSPSVVARFEREVRALAELTHPNTVSVFDYGVTDDGLWYYTMELLDGRNLRETVEIDGPLDPERLISIATQVLRALGEAHGKGIIHRDIKPDNIFIAQLGGESDVAKLLDFGIAKTVISDEETLTRTGWIAGTPAYISPEVLRGRQADARSDLYSFGATLYYALTGARPFSDVPPEAVYEAQLSRRPAPLSAEAGVAIPEALERVVQRCLEKDPAQRYASTRALLSALTSAREQLSHWHAES